MIGNKDKGYIYIRIHVKEPWVKGRQ